MHSHTTARVAASIVIAMIAAACGEEPPAEVGDAESGHADPTVYTARANAAVYESLPFDDDHDFDLARRGFIASREDPVIRRADGGEVWNVEKFAFVDGEAPASVHPSLWRQAKLNGMHGLYEVVDGIYVCHVVYSVAGRPVTAGDKAATHL